MTCLCTHGGNNKERGPGRSRGAALRSAACISRARTRAGPRAGHRGGQEATTRAACRHAAGAWRVAIGGAWRAVQREATPPKLYTRNVGEVLGQQRGTSASGKRGNTRGGGPVCAKSTAPST